MKLLYKFASRSRPAKLFSCLDNIQKMARYDDYEILLTLDEDDETCNTDQFKLRLSYYDKVTPIWGDSMGSKIFAINRDLELVKDFDIIMCHSDDFIIVKEGFDLDVISHYEQGFSGLLHYPDGRAENRLCTYTIMDKPYFDLFGWLYNPAYTSVGADNELHEVAVLLQRYKFVPIVAIRHLHPAYGDAPNDDLYRRNEHPALYAVDLNTLKNRRAINFGLNV